MSRNARNDENGEKSPASGDFGDFIFAKYRKIPKISPEAYILQRPFLRGLYMEGTLRFKIG